MESLQEPKVCVTLLWEWMMVMMLLLLLLLLLLLMIIMMTTPVCMVGVELLLMAHRFLSA